MSVKDFWEWVDDFFGFRVYSTTDATNEGHGWNVVDTSSAGTPTYAPVDGAAAGELAVDMDTQAEAQNVCIDMGNVLQFDIDKITQVEFRLKMNQAALDATSMFAFGLAGDRNDAIDSIAQAALFRVIGSDSLTAVVIETDDGTTDNDDIATGKTLTSGYKDFVISFAAGKRDVRFYIDGEPVAAGTTFDMSAYSGSLQLLMQIQKTSDANANGFTVDRVCIRGRR